MRSLIQCFKLLEFVKSKNVEVRFHGRSPNEASHYCGQCEVIIIAFFCWCGLEVGWLIEFISFRSWKYSISCS